MTYKLSEGMLFNFQIFGASLDIIIIINSVVVREHTLYNVNLLIFTEIHGLACGSLPWSMFQCAFERNIYSASVWHSAP